MPRRNKEEDTTRRRILKVGLTVIGSTVAIGSAQAAENAAAGNQATEQPATEKLAPELVGYQPTPNDWQKCLFCTYFQAPKTCAIVAGAVTREGWCTRFVLLHE